MTFEATWQPVWAAASARSRTYSLKTRASVSCRPEPNRRSEERTHIVNYEFVLEEWLPRFPLQMRYGHYGGDDITSPCDICNVEWLRRDMVDQYDWGRPVPVDV